MRLRDEVAVVTGGSRGIGRAIAVGPAREGADVAVPYPRRAEAAAATVAEFEALGRQAVAVQADTSVKAEVDRMVARVVDRFGRIDILSKNAAVLSVPFPPTGHAGPGFTRIGH